MHSELRLVLMLPVKYHYIIGISQLMTDKPDFF